MLLYIGSAIYSCYVCRICFSILLTWQWRGAPTAGIGCNSLFDPQMAESPPKKQSLAEPGPTPLTNKRTCKVAEMSAMIKWKGRKDERASSESIWDRARVTNVCYLLPLHISTSRAMYRALRADESNAFLAPHASNPGTLKTPRSVPKRTHTFFSLATQKEASNETREIQHEEL